MRNIIIVFCVFSFHLSLYSQNNSEQNLVLGLSNNAQLIRDSCATEIRNLLIKKENVVDSGGIIEHTRLFWENKISSLPPNYESEDLRKYILKNKQASVVNQSHIFQLDNTFSLTVVLFASSGKIRWIELNEHLKFNFIEPDSNFSGIWRNYYINGNLFSESSLENGKLNGIQNRYYPNGHLHVVEYHQGNQFIELRKYHQNGRLKYKRTIVNSSGDSRITKYDDVGKQVSEEVVKVRTFKKKIKNN